MKPLKFIISLVILAGMLATLKAPIGYVIEEEHHVTCSKNTGEENGEDENESRTQKRAGSDYLSSDPGGICNPRIASDFYFLDDPGDDLQRRATGYTAPPPEEN